MHNKAGKILSKVNLPSDLKNLSNDDLHLLCTELREFIIDTVSNYGGHFGASLGSLLNSSGTFLCYFGVTLVLV